MKSPKFFYAMLIASSLVACSKKDLTQPNPPAEGVVTATDESNSYTGPILNQKGVSVNVDANIGGYLEKLPYDYATATTKKYPLLVYIHGIGELGNGTTQLSQVASNSVAKLINNGLFPKSFTVGANTYSFLVISPQFKGWPSATNVNDMITYAIKKYRIDESRIYITGLSMGGGAVMEYGAYFGKRIAAMVPMAECNGSSLVKAQAIANSGVAVWGFHNRYDPRVNYLCTYNYINAINTYKPLLPALKTIFNDNGHNCWTQASDPNYKENGLNIYQWMLKNHR